MATVAQVYAGNQVQLMHDRASGASAVTEYSDRFNAHDTSLFNVQVEWDETSVTYAADITLWASNHADPDDTTDLDWTEMVSDHGFDGLPNPPTGGDANAMVDVSANAALWYRFKLARTGGEALVNMLLSKKKSK